VRAKKQGDVNFFDATEDAGAACVYRHVKPDQGDEGACLTLVTKLAQ